jgi:nucleotide-binding universal stress UspA family protein
VYKKILVPIDGSETSAKGLLEAQKLAKNQQATIRLIHVINELMVVASYEATIYSGELINALRENGQKILNDARQKVVAADISVEAELLEAHGGQAGQVIVNDA